VPVVDDEVDGTVVVVELGDVMVVVDGAGRVMGNSVVVPPDAVVVVSGGTGMMCTAQPPLRMSTPDGQFRPGK
jgi:hypothetical protein